jgi:hypothetical protein
VHGSLSAEPHSREVKKHVENLIIVQILRLNSQVSGLQSLALDTFVSRRPLAGVAGQRTGCRFRAAHTTQAACCPRSPALRQKHRLA